MLKELLIGVGVAFVADVVLEVFTEAGLIGHITSFIIDRLPFLAVV